MSSKTDKLQEKKKRTPKIKIIYICLECMNRGNYTSYSKNQSICPECWIKHKKKNKPKEMLWRKGWTKDLIRYNNMTLLEKLQDVLDRNENAQNIKLDPNHHHGPFIRFTISGFGSSELRYIFYYWGLKWKEHIKEFSISSTDVDFEKMIERWESGFYHDPENEDNDDFYLRVRIWLNKFPDMLNCEHDFRDRSDWGKKICEKCGLFEKLD
jgi:hypothetical protein